MDLDQDNGVLVDPRAARRLTHRRACSGRTADEGAEVDEDLIAVQLLDGRTVRIRPISPSDGDALVGVVLDLSPWREGLAGAGAARA